MPACVILKGPDLLAISLGANSAWDPTYGMYGEDGSKGSGEQDLVDSRELVRAGSGVASVDGLGGGGICRVAAEMAVQPGGQTSGRAVGAGDQADGRGLASFQG